MDPKKTIQAHGFTHAEIEEIGQQQVNGEETMIAANNAKPDQIGDPYFKKDYANFQIADHEVGFYHIAKEARLFSQTGAEPIRLSTPSVIKLNPKFYEFMKDNHAFDGAITHILHDPSKASASKVEDEDEEEGGDGEGFDVYTVPELKEYLDNKGVEYPASSKKADLVKLAEEAE